MYIGGWGARGVLRPQSLIDSSDPSIRRNIVRFVQCHSVTIHMYMSYLRPWNGDSLKNRVLREVVPFLIYPTTYMTHKYHIIIDDA